MRPILIAIISSSQGQKLVLKGVKQILDLRLLGHKILGAKQLLEISKKDADIIGGSTNKTDFG
jgi:hypothetical protein